MIDDRPVGEEQRLLEQAGEVGGAGHGLGEATKEPSRLPPDHLVHQLVATAREVAVDRRPRHFGLARDVLHRRLGQPVAGDALVGRLQHAARGA